MLLLWLIVSLLFLIGLAGVIVPGLPGISIIWAGIVIFVAVTGFEFISLYLFLFISALAIIATLTDYIGSAYGAKLGGGSKKTLAGSIIGLFAGSLTAGPIGIIIGAFLGALIGAILEGKDRKQATRAAVYSILGILGATVIQLIFAFVIIITFLIAAI